MTGSSTRRRTRAPSCSTSTAGPGTVAGQHADVRLTAEDGYQAERSYSIASAPEDPAVSLTVERIDDGEVSPYLAGEVRDGDQFELRGPIGGHFTWRAQQGGPLLLVGGGSGLVPLMAMLRHRAAAGSDARPRAARVVAHRGGHPVPRGARAARVEGDGLAVHHTLTRGAPEGWDGLRPACRRRDADRGRAARRGRPRIFVCGPTPFVEAVADLLVGLGPPARLDPCRAIRTNRRLR